MARLGVDVAAWCGPWRHRSVAEKALLSGGLTLIAVTARSAWVLAVVLGAVLVLAVAVARVPWRSYLTALAAPAVFVVVGVAALTISVGDVPTTDRLVGVGPVALTRSGLATAGFVALRSLAGTAAVLLLATTTPLLDLLTGMRRLRIPEPVIDIAGLMYRLLFALLASVSAIREAQAARLGYATARAARASFGMLAAATLRRAWDQSRRLEDGLAGRGYVGSLRTLTAPQPVSVPFVTCTLLGITALAGWSLWLAVTG